MVWGRRSLDARLLHEVGLDKWLEVTVHNTLDISDFHLGPMVVDHGIRLEDVGANLTTPFDFLLGALELVFGSFLDLAFELIDAALQHRHGALAVLQLAAFLRTLGDDPSLLTVRKLALPNEANACFDLVNVLPPFAAGSEGLKLDFVGAHVDLDTIVDLRVDEHTRERGMSSAARIER